MHTVSLEVARSMKEAGWEQEGKYCYVLVPKISVGTKQRYVLMEYVDTYLIDYDPHEIYFAPQLGDIVRELRPRLSLVRGREGGSWCIIDDRYPARMFAASDTPEDAAGLAWVKQQGGTS